MRVLVAGGSGFIGRATVQALLDEGHTVVVLSRDPDRGWRDTQALQTVPADAAKDLPDPDTLGSVDAIVNLIGIARREGDNTFERAHVQSTRNLVGLAHEIGCRRFIHVSVVRVSRARGRYFETKARGEGTVEGSGLDWTIVRPGLVYGEGDQTMTQLVQLVRLSAVFPVPGGRPGALQVVDVRDVARGIALCLQDPRSHGRFYDIVGPRRFTLSELVHEVAAALRLSVWTPRIPRAVMRAATESMQLLLPDPPMTRTQLGMLVAGLYGDPRPARDDLGLTPDPLTPERIRELAEAIDDLAPSPRIVTGFGHRQWLRGLAPISTSLLWLLPLALLTLLALPYAITSVWLRMGAAYAVLTSLALGGVALPWRALLRPSIGRVSVGLGFAALMYGAALGVMSLLEHQAPAFLQAAAPVFAWAEELPTAAAVAALVSIVIAEDLVWRGAITIPLAARLGPWRGALLAGALFGLSHLSTGPPVLWLAAWLAGTAWSVLAIRTRSLVPVIVSHASWDLAMVVTGL